MSLLEFYCLEFVIVAVILLSGLKISTQKILKSSMFTFSRSDLFLYFLYLTKSMNALIHPWYPHGSFIMVFTFKIRSYSEYSRLSMMRSDNAMMSERALIASYLKADIIGLSAGRSKTSSRIFLKCLCASPPDRVVTMLLLLLSFCRDRDC